MLNHEERLKSFLDSINRETQEKYNKILGEIEEQSKKELDEATKIAERQAQDFFNKSVAKSKVESNNKIAGKMMETRAELSKLREKITADIFSEAKDRLNAFTESSDYEAFVAKSAASVLALLGEGAQVYVKDADLKFKKVILKVFNNNCTVSADSDIEIGGLKAKKADGTLIADDTLDSRLKQQYEWFLSNCNLSVDFQ